MAVETVCMVRAAGRSPQGEATVVVLGCKVQGETPSHVLRERLEAARLYLEVHPEAMCILSGGKGQGEDISEAACMYRYLTGQGIDPSRLYCEDRSTSTRENLAFSQEIIEEQGLCPSIAIVTSEFHGYRAGKIAEQLGLEWGSVPSKTAWWLLPTYYARELYGILYQWLGLGA